MNNDQKISTAIITARVSVSISVSIYMLDKTQHNTTKKTTQQLEKSIEVGIVMGPESIQWQFLVLSLSMYLDLLVYYMNLNTNIHLSLSLSLFQLATFTHCTGFSRNNYLSMYLEFKHWPNTPFNLLIIFLKGLMTTIRIDRWLACFSTANETMQPKNLSTDCHVSG